MNIFKWFTIGFDIVSEIVKAAKDGQVTIDEIIAIVEKLIIDLGIQVTKKQSQTTK